MVLEEIRLKDEKSRREIMDKPGCSPCDRPAVDPTYFETYKQYQAKQRAVSDPTTLILVDEADRLQMNSLEQMRLIFDEGTAGMVLIGMPGIEKRIARFPQFYSRIGFVHEFRPLDANQVQELLERRWTPAGVTLPDEKLIPEGHRQPHTDDRRKFQALDSTPHPNRTGSPCQRPSPRLQ